MTVRLGDTARDKITGFTGVVTGLVEYISGCNQALLVPPAQDGKLPDFVWYDIQRLEVTDAKRIVLDNAATPGHDRAAPKR